MRSIIQAAIKEDEEVNPTKRTVRSQKTASDKTRQKSSTTLSGQELLDYAKERLLKPKPGKIQPLNNFLSAMFQFQGGINEAEVKKLVKALEKDGVLKLNGTKVLYT